MTESLSVEQRAEYLHISERTIYRLLRRGELPGRKVGGNGGSARPRQNALIALYPRFVRA